jgi:hypothetical protein
MTDEKRTSEASTLTLSLAEVARIREHFMGDVWSGNRADVDEVFRKVDAFWCIETAGISEPEALAEVMAEHRQRSAEAQSFPARVALEKLHNIAKVHGASVEANRLWLVVDQALDELLALRRESPQPSPCEADGCRWYVTGDTVCPDGHSQRTPKAPQVEYCHERFSGGGRFRGYACCGRSGHDGQHHITEGGKPVMWWGEIRTEGAARDNSEPTRDNKPDAAVSRATDNACADYALILKGAADYFEREGLLGHVPELRVLVDAVRRLPVPLVAAVNAVANALRGSTVFLHTPDGGIKVAPLNADDADEDAPPLDEQPNAPPVTPPRASCGWCKGNPIGDCVICQARPSTPESYADVPRETLTDEGQRRFERREAELKDLARKAMQPKSTPSSCVAYPPAGSVTREETRERLCKLLGVVWLHFDPGAHEPCDCFCEKANLPKYFKSSGQALAWVEAVVLSALKRSK